MGFIKWLINGLSAKNKALLIGHIFKNDKLSKEDKQQIAIDTLSNLDEDAKKGILKTLLSVAVAGGNGYLVGGNSGAGMAAAEALLKEIDKK